MQRRLNKKTLKFGKTMERNGETWTAPKYFRFHYDSSGAGPKVPNNKKLWWRLQLDPDTIPNVNLDKEVEKIPQYLLLNFKSKWAITATCSLTTNQTTKLSDFKSRKYHIEEPDFEIFKNFGRKLNSAVGCSHERLSFKIPEVANTTMDAGAKKIEKCFDWQNTPPTEELLKKFSLVPGPESRCIIAENKLYVILNYKPHDTYYRFAGKQMVFNLDVQNSLKNKMSYASYDWPRSVVKNFLSKKIKELDFSVENLPAEGSSIIIQMDLQSQELTFKAKDEFRKFGEEMEALFEEMKEYKYSKKTLKKVLQRANSLKSFFHSWQDRNDALPWK